MRKIFTLLFLVASVAGAGDYSIGAEALLSDGLGYESALGGVAGDAIWKRGRFAFGFGDGSKTYAEGFRWSATVAYRFGGQWFGEIGAHHAGYKLPDLWSKSLTQPLVGAGYKGRGWEVSVSYLPALSDTPDEVSSIPIRWRLRRGRLVLATTGKLVMFDQGSSSTGWSVAQYVGVGW